MKIKMSHGMQWEVSGVSFQASISSMFFPSKRCSKGQERNLAKHCWICGLVCSRHIAGYIEFYNKIPRHWCIFMQKALTVTTKAKQNFSFTKVTVKRFFWRKERWNVNWLLKSQTKHLASQFTKQFNLHKSYKNSIHWLLKRDQ